MGKVRLIQKAPSACIGKNITAYELGNGCQYNNRYWVCMDTANGCRHKNLRDLECIYKAGKFCTCATAMADAYNLLQQRLEYVTSETLFAMYERWLEVSSKKDRSYRTWFKNIGMRVIPERKEDQ